MGGRHVLELEVAQGRAYVYSDYLLVPLEGGRPHRIGHAVRQPPIQVLPHLQVVRVEHEAPRRIAPRLSQLPLDLLVLPTVDHFALRTIRGLNGVTGHVPAILALSDAVAFRGHFYSSPVSNS